MPKKKLSREEVIKEISELKGELSLYNKNPNDFPESYPFVHKVRRLQFLRNSLNRRGSENSDKKDI